MKQILEELSEVAKENLKQDGHIASVMFLFRDKKPIMKPRPFMPFNECNAYDANGRNAFVAGLLAKKTNADMIVLITDGAFKAVSHQHPDETDSPLSYPRSMRTECIMVTGIRIPSGEADVVVVPYKGGEGEPVEFIPNEFPKEARFETRFSDLAVEGWEKADLLPDPEML